jgi:hypothetical protein
MKQLADCSSNIGGGGAGAAGARDVVLDWRADPFVSLSDLTLNVYTTTTPPNDNTDNAIHNNNTEHGIASQQQQQQKAPTVYYTHTLLMAYGGRKSNFIAEQIRNQRRSSKPTSTRQHVHNSNNITNRGGGKGTLDKLILTESIVGRAYDKVIHRQNSNTSYSSSGSSFVESSNTNHNHNNMVEYKVDIHLPHLAAYYLPLVLDYMYGSSLTYTTTNAVPLRYLAYRFAIHELYTTITKTFISCDLSLATVSTYITLADSVCDYDMRDVAICYLSQRLYKLSTTNTNDKNDSSNDTGVEILACLEPRLLRRVLQCDKLVSGTSEQISILLAKYLQLYTNNCQSSTTTNNNNNSNNNKVINSFTNVTLPSSIINNNTEPTTATIASAVLTDEDFYWLTHCQIMPRIDPTVAIYYFAYAATYFPLILVEVGSGSLKSRCLLACSLSSCSVDEDTTKNDRKKDGSSSSTNVVLDNLTSYIEQRGITTDDNPSSQQQQQQQQQPSSNMMIESYINLDYRYKVQLLESTLVGAKKQLNAKTKQYNFHNAMYDEVQQTENIMYKKNTMKTLSSALTSPSMSSINTGVIDNYNDTVVSKAVVLGCGILSANGLYLSSSTPTNKMMGGDSVTIYEREGIWNGQHVTFVLYPVTLGQYYLQYKLGVRNCTPETREDNCDNNHSGVAKKKKKKIRILYNSPKIVIGDHATSFNGSGGQYHCNNRGGNQQQQQIIIPEGEWEVEQQVNGSNGIGGIGVPMSEDISPAPQFVGRVEQ